MKTSLKLHDHTGNYSWLRPCGPFVVATLTGKSVDQVIDEMLRYRRSRPRYTTEYTWGNKREYYYDGDTMYLTEMMHFTRHLHRKRKPLYLQKKLSITEISRAIEKPIVAATSNHFALIERGRVSDNQWYRIDPSRTYFGEQVVKYVIPLSLAA